MNRDDPAASIPKIYCYMRRPCLHSVSNVYYFQICFDFDLCGRCYENGSVGNRDHNTSHAMQCIMTRNDMGGFVLCGLPYVTEETFPYTKAYAVCVSCRVFWLLPGEGGGGGSKSVAKRRVLFAHFYFEFVLV